MPIIDMPLEQLLTYQGVNPKPRDFDEYWARALNEMHAMGTAHERVRADFQAPGVTCYDLWFTGVGGVKGNTHKGQIIRGLDDPDSDKLLTRNLFLDTAHLARIVMDFPEVDPERVGATGGSQGGALTLACASLETRVKRLAPVFPFMCDYRRVWDLDLDVAAYAELREHFRRSDPQHKRVDEIFTKLGYIDLQHLANRIQGETVLCCGLMDTICPPSTQFAAYNKITAPKRYEIWPDFGHEGLPGSDEIIFEFMLGL